MSSFIQIHATKDGTPVWRSTVSIDPQHLKRLTPAQLKEIGNSTREVVEQIEVMVPTPKLRLKLASK